MENRKISINGAGIVYEGREFEVIVSSPRLYNAVWFNNMGGTTRLWWDLNTGEWQLVNGRGTVIQSRHDLTDLLLWAEDQTPPPSWASLGEGSEWCDFSVPKLSVKRALQDYNDTLAHRRPTKQFDALDFIIQYETEGFEDDEDIIYGLTQLRDSGMLFQLQGSWQRAARAYGVI